MHAMPAEAAKRSVTVVLGMHRSGTSLCAHVLAALGIDMANDPLPTEHNAKGHWEHWETAVYGDQIFDLLGRPYYSPTHILALPPAWWLEASLQPVRAELIEWLRARLAARPIFGFKDPRTCRLLPFWKQVFTELNLTPRYILCVRDPQHVIRSVVQRDGFDLSEAEYRWLLYTMHAIAEIGGTPVAVMPYESWFTDPTINLKRLIEHLALPFNLGDPVMRLAIHAIIDADLRHDQAGPMARPALFSRALHGLLLDAAPEGRLSQRLRTMAADFVGLEQLFSSLQMTVRTKAGAQTAELAQAALTIEGLRALLAQRDGPAARTDPTEDNVAPTIGPADGLLVHAQGLPFGARESEVGEWARGLE